MRLHVSTDIPLSEPNASSGLVTWFSIDIFPDDDAPKPDRIGHARVARIHISNPLDLNVPLLDVLDADSGELEALHDISVEND
ncbi:MAG TPA: hypothetical protein VM694_17235 [Polyangium sp.]|nr:hypothetical protein [Polyangium sp.]